MDQVLKSHILPEFTQHERDNLSNTTIIKETEVII